MFQEQEMKNAFGKWSQHQFHSAPPLSANVLTLPMTWLETWNDGRTNWLVRLAGLLFLCELRHRVFMSQNKLLKYCSRYHTKDENASVTAAKAFLKKYLGVLVFEVLVFVVSVFVILVFEVLVFEVLGFDTPSFTL